MSDQSSKNPPPDRLAWWREARFGMFIHWGLYALPAGEWKGQTIPGLGEWIMRNARIPIPEYEALAQSFNPVRFNAEEWVSLAKRAGMKYLVITAKHHDGFAMYDSPSSNYDIVDATPFGKDPMKDLAAACAKAGIRLCFYYSQAQDWHAPGGAGHWEEADETDWWSQPVAAERFARYLEEKVKPQLRELLTQYGPVGLIWFDTPVVITREQSLELRELVHSIQPDCLVSGRVGHGVGDYGSLGDNQIPRGPVQGDWETPATINDTWGYRKDDHNWKSVKDLLTLLVDLTSKGVNYLLNVGPTAEGIIPEPSVQRLLAIGKWLEVNGEAIYGTRPSPYPYELSWGRVTTKGNRLFLHFFHWPREFRLYGLRNQVRRAWLLTQPAAPVGVTQTHDATLDAHVLDLDLPCEAPDPLVSVVVLDLEGDVDVDASLYPQLDGSIILPAHLAQLHREVPQSSLHCSPSGVITGWRHTGDWLSWVFKALQPGLFQVRVTLVGSHGRKASTGHRAAVAVANTVVSGVLRSEETVHNPRSHYFPEHASLLGTVQLPQPGEYRLSLRALELVESASDGLALGSVALSPVAP